MLSRLSVTSSDKFLYQVALEKKRRRGERRGGEDDTLTAGGPQDSPKKGIGG